MPKQIPQADLDALTQAVGQFPEGASIKDIAGALKRKVPRRTLQRHLVLLVMQKSLIVEGRGRGSRYRRPFIEAATSVVATADMKGNADITIPLSAEGNAIRQAVRSPIQLRQPVGYNRNLLDAYRPNESFYLHAETRLQLFELGKPANGPGPAGTYARKIFNRLLIDLSWNSSRLEGNTYSLLETERLLQSGRSAEGKDVRETQMILNHKAAIELLVEHADEIGFNRYTIRNLHALLADNLLSDPQAAGHLREIPVGIGGTVYIPSALPQLVQECFDKILETAGRIQDPFEQAFFVMVHLPYLQPFEDVNKRVSRLAANIPLIRENLCPLSFVDVPDHVYIAGILGVYELNRIELLRDVFIWAYQQSCARYSQLRRTLGEPDPFRMQYRQSIYETVSEVVRDGMDKAQALEFIRQHALQSLPERDRHRFIEIVETELMSLHEGNIARYRIRPQQFQAWHTKWH